MRLVKSHLYKVMYVLTSVSGGLFIYLMLISTISDTYLLTSKFHTQLFEKNKIYEHTYNVIQSSFSKFIKNLEKNSSYEYGQGSEVLLMLKNSITPGMVHSNLDSLRDGLIKYFRGDSDYLPDISIHKKLSAPEDGINPTPGLNTSSSLLYGIDKINLSAIFHYINRNEIPYQLQNIKLFYYVMLKLPGFSLLAVILSFLAGVIFCSNFKHIQKWWIICFIACSVLLLTSGLALLLYCRLVIPKVIYPLSVSLPLPSEVIISYINDCFGFAAIFMIFTAFVPSLLSFAFHRIALLFKNNTTKTVINKSEKLNTAHNQKLIIKYSVYTILFTAIITVSIIKVQAIKKDFEENDFMNIISRLSSKNTVTRVITAKNDAIYTLHIKIVENKTGIPVRGVSTNITGKSNLTGREFNENGITDDNGEIKLNLEKGNFRAAFASPELSKKFKIPSPYFFSLKTAGTTIVTINLENITAEEEFPIGIVEVQLLDAANVPIPGIELSIVSGSKPSEAYPDYFYSYTNSDGIAVFKVATGMYLVDLPDKAFPAKYIKPDPFLVEASGDKTSRYSIRLVETLN